MTSYEIISQTPKDQIALALTYIQLEKYMCLELMNKDERMGAGVSGELRGILLAAQILGEKDFYGSVITPLRNAMQKEAQEWERAIKPIEINSEEK